MTGDVLRCIPIADIAIPQGGRGLRGGKVANLVKSLRRTLAAEEINDKPVQAAQVSRDAGGRANKDGLSEAASEICVTGGAVCRAKIIAALTDDAKAAPDPVGALDEGPMRPGRSLAEIAGDRADRTVALERPDPPLRRLCGTWLDATPQRKPEFIGSTSETDHTPWKDWVTQALLAALVTGPGCPFALETAGGGEDQGVRHGP